MKSIGIIANVKKELTKGVVEEIIGWAGQNGFDFFICEELISLVGHREKSLPRVELGKESHLLVSLGGDGTMLASARAVGEHQTPILGINLGGVGFLTEINCNDIQNTLGKLKQGDYFIEKRMVLETEVEGAGKLDQYALNDVVLDKGEVARLFLSHLYLQDEFICSYSADGLIVSTPTGSTAYCLAAGGPIINPRMNAIIVSPICPHTLASRPIVFSENETLKVVVELSSRHAVLTIDGQVAFNLKSGSSVSIRKAKHPVNLVKFRDRSFYDILRTKLHWGARPKTGE
ncbi:MAG: NAD(+)/NADH kinase [Candidatus Zixiibacteriota bacterium]|nr:MAG: NAD(+)/NADH kinase [candidate division Zixibacteria bacterium]